MCAGDTVTRTGVGLEQGGATDLQRKLRSHIVHVDATVRSSLPLLNGMYLN